MHEAVRLIVYKYGHGFANGVRAAYRCVKPFRDIDMNGGKREAFLRCSEKV